MDQIAEHPDPSTPVAFLRPAIQRILDDFLATQRSLLAHASPELVSLVDAGSRLIAGGKRLRPTFCYWGWRAAGGVDNASHERAILTVAASLELFQAAALVHDDLIDASDTRRGQPSVHRQFAARHDQAGWRGDAAAFGNAAAVLLGDLLLGWSSDLFQASQLENEAFRRGRAVFEQMRTEVGGGQYLDVLEQVREPEGTAEAIRRACTVIRYKSARYSVEHPLAIGANLTLATDDVLASLRRYGSTLGEAFQLRDDVLGVFGDPDQTGKPAGDDLREGKRTILIAFALERADAQQTALVTRLLGDPDLDTAGVDALRQVIDDTGALARVETLVATLVDQAHHALDTAAVTADGHQALTAMIDLATTRTH